MPFRFTRKDLKLTDGNKNNAIQLRNRMLELYNDLLLKMETEKDLVNYIKYLRARRNGLRTRTPYVSNYYMRTGDIRRSTWIGFADHKKYPDPRTGIQFQLGIRREDAYWFGLWIQGDAKTRQTQRNLHSVLIKYSLEQITSSINALGTSYWLKASRDNDDKIIIDNPADKVTIEEVEEFRNNLEKKRLWISLDKVIKNHNKNDLLLIKDVTAEIIKTTLDLLPIFDWWSGTKPRETPADEAYNILDKGGKLEIIDEDSGPITTDVDQAIVSRRIGQNVIRRAILNNYKHQCAICDVQNDEFLVASHILPWSLDKENRGNLRNVLCLCTIHDFLFERGKLRVTPALNVEFANELIVLSQNSAMLKGIINNTYKKLKKPIKYPPDPEFLKKKMT